MINSLWFWSTCIPYKNKLLHSLAQSFPDNKDKAFANNIVTTTVFHFSKSFFIHHVRFRKRPFSDK